MATISTISGGIENKLTHQAAELARWAEPKTVEIPAESPPEPAQTPPEPTQSVSIDDLHNMVAEIQQTLDSTSHIPLRVGFRLDERADGYVIEIKNEYGEVIRQFPPEKALNLRSKLDELSGMVIDEMS